MNFFLGDVTCDPQQLMVTFDNDADPGIKKKFSPLQDGENLRILVKFKMSTNYYEILLGGWDVSIATNSSTLVLIRITILIQEFLTEFLPQRDRTICKNIAGSAALAGFAISECFWL